MKHPNSLYTLEDELFPPDPKPRHPGWLKWAILLTLCVLFVYRSTRPSLRLSAAPPPSFFGYNQNWTPQERRKQRHLAEAYWRVAVRRIQGKYSPESSLPADPPPQFRIADAAQNLESDVAAARIRYWQRLRDAWNQQNSWVIDYGWNTDWVGTTLNTLPQYLPRGVANVFQTVVDFFHAVAQAISSS